MSKLPAFQFYPGDWMKDPALRSCASAARGLWMDMLCLMSEVGHRGFLQTPAGKPVSTEQLARMVGSTPVEVRDLLAELEDAGVFSRTADGVIYSRRMVRDEETRQRHRQNGLKGGNPSIVKGGVKGEVKGGVKPKKARGVSGAGSLEPTPSSSSSSSSSPSGEEIPPNPPFDTPLFAAAWSEWSHHRKAKKATLTPQAVKQQFKFLAGLGLEQAIATIEYSIRQGYTGLVENTNGRPADRPGGADGRRGRAVAEPGKYAHLDGPPGVAAAPGPPGPDLFGPARDPPVAGGGGPAAA